MKNSQLAHDEKRVRELKLCFESAVKDGGRKVGKVIGSLGLT